MMFNVEFYIRLAVAALCGFAVGHERKVNLKMAGVRTHIIVAVGTCLIMIISKYGFTDILKEPDPSRLAAQVVSGIGFLGAGMIIFRHNAVQGTATAAGIWTTAAVGLAIGAGMYDLGVLTTALVIAVQIFIGAMGLDPGQGKQISMKIVVKDYDEAYDVIGVIRKNGAHITEYSITRLDNNLCRLSCDMLIMRDEHFRDLLGEYAYKADFRVIEP